MPLYQTSQENKQNVQGWEWVTSIGFVGQWATVDTIDYPPEHYNKTLLLKMSSTWIIEHEEIKLANLEAGIHTGWLYMVLESAVHITRGEKSS